MKYLEELKAAAPGIAFETEGMVTNGHSLRAGVPGKGIVLRSFREWQYFPQRIKGTYGWYGDATGRPKQFNTAADMVAAFPGVFVTTLPPLYSGPCPKEYDFPGGAFGGLGKTLTDHPSISQRQNPWLVQGVAGTYIDALSPPYSAWVNDVRVTAPKELATGDVVSIRVDANIDELGYVSMAEFDRVTDDWEATCLRLKARERGALKRLTALTTYSETLRKKLVCEEKHSDSLQERVTELTAELKAKAENNVSIETPANRVGSKAKDALTGKPCIVLPGPVDSLGRAMVYYGEVREGAAHSQDYSWAWLATLDPDKPEPEPKKDVKGIVVLTLLALSSMTICVAVLGQILWAMVS